MDGETDTGKANKETGSDGERKRETTLRKVAENHGHWIIVSPTPFLLILRVTLHIYFKIQLWFLPSSRVSLSYSPIDLSP